MALQDIMTAITAQADREIAVLRDQHSRRSNDLRECHRAAMDNLKNGMAKQVESRKAQLLLKMQTHAAVERRNRIASVKQEVIDETFKRALDRLSALPEKKVEPLLKACLDQIKDAGVLHPSKKHEPLVRKLVTSDRLTVGAPSDIKGGFRFVGKKSEADFSFEHLLLGVLRPMKEVEVATLLFGNA